MIEFTYRTKHPDDDEKVLTGTVRAETLRQAARNAIKQAWGDKTCTDNIWFTGSPFDHGFAFPVIELKEEGKRRGVNFVCFNEHADLEGAAKYNAETYRRIFSLIFLK